MINKDNIAKRLETLLLMRDLPPAQAPMLLPEPFTPAFEGPAQQQVDVRSSMGEQGQGTALEMPPSTPTRAPAPTVLPELETPRATAALTLPESGFPQRTSLPAPWPDAPDASMSPEMMATSEVEEGREAGVSPWEAPPTMPTPAGSVFPEPSPLPAGFPGGMGATPTMPPIEQSPKETGPLLLPEAEPTPSGAPPVQLPEASPGRTTLPPGPMTTEEPASQARVLDMNAGEATAKDAYAMPTLPEPSHSMAPPTATGEDSRGMGGLTGLFGELKEAIRDLVQGVKPGEGRKAGPQPDGSFIPSGPPPGFGSIFGSPFGNSTYQG